MGRVLDSIRPKYSMKKHITYLENAKSFFRGQSWMMLTFETASGVLFGAVLKASISGDLRPWVAILVGGFWISFVIVKYLSQKHFPTAIVDDLVAQTQLTAVNEELVRRNIVLGFLSESVTTLNGETCKLENSGAHPTTGTESLCQMSIEDGLRTVLAPLVQRPHQILGCIESKFTVFVGVLDYSRENIGDSNHPNQFICLRDDFGISNQIDDGLMRDSKTAGFRLDTQEAVRRAFNGNHLHRTQTKLGDGALSIMVSPLPIVCDPTAVDGVILIFTNCGHQYPSDLEGTLKIYGQIVSNWRWHYSECEFRVKHGIRLSDAIRMETSRAEEGTSTVKVSRLGS